MFSLQRTVTTLVYNVNGRKKRYKEDRGRRDRGSIASVSHQLNSHRKFRLRKPRATSAAAAGNQDS
jgi:hypothetical protein